MRHEREDPARQAALPAPRGQQRPALTAERILVMLSEAGGTATQIELYSVVRLVNNSLDELLVTLGRMRRAGLITASEGRGGRYSRT